MLSDKNNVIFITTSIYQETITYAAKELHKYICAMAGTGASSVIGKPKTEGAKCIELGLFSDFGIVFNDLEDVEKDDAIYVNIKDSNGIIAGSNPRSVLFATYRFLEQNGCRWIRLGKDGEIIPNKNVDNLSGSAFEKAGTRFRGNSVVYSCKLEDLLDKIDFLPKVGANTQFLEGFDDTYMFFDWWYKHEYHSLSKPENHSVTEYKAYLMKAKKEVKKRGLILQTVGHGWSQLFIQSVVGHEVDYNCKVEEGKEYLALVRGERKNHTLGFRVTELCYGNPWVRERLVKCFVDYVEENKDEDIVQFWLGDFLNVNCNCELCNSTRPSDFYVSMLNSMDEELSRRGLDNRIGFLVGYAAALWPPEKEVINNPGRFVMTFAPCGRSYNEPYRYDSHVELPEFEYNNLKPTRGFEPLMASLKEWKKNFAGDCIIFDYHTTWYHYFDLGYYGLTRVWAEDIKRLPMMDICGFLSCNITRASFPNSLPDHIFYKLLWNSKSDIDILTNSYFSDTYGEDWELCLNYLNELSQLSGRDYFYKPRREYKTDFNSFTDEELQIIDNLKSIPKVIDCFRSVIERNLNLENQAQLKSWKYLLIHADLTLLLSYCLKAKIEGKHEVAEEYWLKIIDFIMINESKIQSAFDSMWFFKTYESRGFMHSKTVIDYLDIT